MPRIEPLSLDYDSKPTFQGGIEPFALDYDVADKTLSKDAPTSNIEPLALEHGMEITPEKKRPSGAGGDFEEPWDVRFIRESPNLYGLYGVTKELSKMGHLKYLYPEERQKYRETPDKLKTRKLLWDTAEDVGAVGLGRILKGLGGIAGKAAKRYLPKIHKLLTTPAKELLGKNKVVGPELRSVLEAIAEKEDPTLALLKPNRDAVYGGKRPLTTKELGVQKVEKEIPKLTDQITESKVTGKLKSSGTEKPIAKIKADTFLKEKGLPIKDVPKEDLKIFKSEKTLERLNAFREQKGLRPFKETIDDIKLFIKGNERGSMSFERLATEEQEAIKRLVNDAKIAGKNVKDYLVEMELDKKLIPIIENYAKAASPKAGKEALPKYAQSVNLEKQNLSDTAKKLQVEMAGKKKYQSWDKTEELGNEILSDIKKTNKVLVKAGKGQGLNAEEIHVTRQVNVNAQDTLAKMIDDVNAGTITNDVFQKEFGKVRDDIFKVVSEGSGEIGRALNYHKKHLSANRMTKALAKIEGQMTPRQQESFLRAVKNQDNPAEVARFLNTVEDPKLKDYVLEFWYNAILSGPPTHVVNTVSNTGWQSYQLGHRPHVAMWDKIYSTLTGKARTRYVNEMIPMMAGYKTGAKRGASGALQMMKKGELAEFETKWAQEVGNSSVGAWERSPHAWMRKAAPAVSFFTRGLRAMDVWANSIAYDAEMNSVARRIGMNKGLKGNNLFEFEAKFKQNPPQSAHDQAMKMAKHSTFMDDPDPFTKWFLKLRKDVPVLGPGSQFIVPFVNTIGNLTKRGLEFTPGVGVAKEAISRQMGRGLGTPEMIAKQVEGSLLSLYVLYKCDKGDITGQAPTGKSAKDAFYRQNKKAWAIRLGGKVNPKTGKTEGGTWVQYRRIEPFNTVIASVATSYDKIKNAKDDATKTEIFGEIASGMKNNLIDSSYFQGLQQVFNRHEKFKTAPFRMGASFVPYSSFWRSINRAYEKATEGDTKVRNKQGWLPAFAQVIPGLSGKVPAELNVWGEEKVIPGSIFQHWLPYKWSKESSDPVEKALEKLQIYPSLPSAQYTYKGKKHTFDNDIYRKFCIDYGHKAKKYLDVQINKPIWEKAFKDEAKSKIMAGIIDGGLTSIRNISRIEAILNQTKSSKKETKITPKKKPAKTRKVITLESRKYEYLEKLPDGSIRIKDIETGEIGTYTK